MAFTTHYEELPSVDLLQALERAQAANIDPSIMSGLMAINYQKCLDDLVARNWLVNVFWHYLNTDPWPPSDKAQGQLIGTGSNKKWAREQGKLEQWIPCMKSQRFPDGLQMT